MEKFKNIENIVWKTAIKFIYNLITYIGYEIELNDYKEIAYGNKLLRNGKEEEIKNIVDAYIYLLNNEKSLIGNNLLKRYYYILTGNMISEDKIEKIRNCYYEIDNLSKIEKAVKCHFLVYEISLDINEKYQKIIALQLLSYLLIRAGYIGLKAIINYEQIILSHKNGSDMECIEFIINYLEKAKVQPKDYYENLTKLTSEELIEVLLKEKNNIMNKFNISKMIIFGSFANSNYRIDSDIDLMVSFSYPYNYNKKLEIINDLKIYLKGILNRFVDIHEISESLSEKMIIETINHIKII